LGGCGGEAGEGGGGGAPGAGGGGTTGGGAKGESSLITVFETWLDEELTATLEMEEECEAMFCVAEMWELNSSLFCALMALAS